MSIVVDWATGIDDKGGARGRRVSRVSGVGSGGGRFARSPSMNRNITAVLVGLSALFLAGCQTLADLNIQNPTYRLMNIRPRVDVAIPFSASRIDFDMAIGVDNPNSIGLRLDRMDFDLFVNGTRVVSGLTNQRIRIPAEGTGTLDLTASVGYNEISSLFREVVGWVQGGRPDYEIRGKAFYDTPIGQMSFPVTVYRAGS
jgi:LEA14-like dessication related protein